MRLLHVNHRYAPFVGGSERFVQEVSEHRARLGDDVSVVVSNAFDLEYLWDRRFQPVDAPPAERINGVEVRRVSVHHPPGSAMAFPLLRRLTGDLSRLTNRVAPFELMATNLPSLPTLTQVMESAGPFDVVHVTNLGLEGLAVAACRFAAMIGAPYIATPFVHLGVDDATVARRLVTMPHQRKILREAHAVVTMTRREAEFVEALGVEPRRVVVSGAGVDFREVTGGDAERFRRAYGIRGPIVAAIGALAADKGTPHLVEAVADLRRSGLEVELVLAGPPISGFQRWFGRLPAEYRTGIHLLGFIDASAKRDLLAAADILALPSRTESFGIVYLEAWANRKPVIAARVGGVVEVVTDGYNGLLVQYGDVAAIADTIRRLLDDRGLATRLGERGHELAVTQFQWSDVVKRVDRAYDLAIR